MIVQSRSLCRSSCSPALLSLMTEPIATAVSSRGTAPRRSRSTKKDERTTTRLTPVLCAASTIAPVESAITDPPPPSVLSNASALASARATSAASVALPATTRRLELRIVSFSGERTSAVTVWPAASACSTTRRPVRPLQFKDLAVVANGSLSRLSHVISRLERQGWVRRVSGAKGRATNAELTDKGYRKLMEAGPIHFAEVRRLVFDVLTPEEVKELRRVTSRINAGLIPETNLGPLARRTRTSALRQSR